MVIELGKCEALREVSVSHDHGFQWVQPEIHPPEMLGQIRECDRSRESIAHQVEISHLRRKGSELDCAMQTAVPHITVSQVLWEHSCVEFTVDIGVGNFENHNSARKPFNTGKLHSEAIPPVNASDKIFSASNTVPVAGVVDFGFFIANAHRGQGLSHTFTLSEAKEVQHAYLLELEGLIAIQ